ncbi:RidA family protein [Chitinophaga caseinilytica]|uniref:RidA family protein n=1 Tax=Chitinophaga caseinilytica TaxID=2267521 RepID=UPI003C2CA186
MKNLIQHITPEQLYNNPAYSHAVVAQGAGRTIYLGGQNSLSKEGTVLFPGDIKGQSAQVMQNLTAVLEAANALPDHLMKLTMHIVQGQNLQEGYEGAQPFLSKLKHPPAVTMAFVAGLAHPDYLVEIDGVAFVPDGE